MEFENIIYEKKEGIAKITLNRPKALNALNLDIITEIKEAIEDAKNDDNVKVVIITGAGRAFAAGADIKWMVDKDALEIRDKYIKFGRDVLREIELLEKPVIAMINGIALGGGNELAMACDIRIASEKAIFGQPEVNLGIIPGYGGTQRLPRLVGKGKAKELVLTGDSIDANEAYRIGLVDKVVPPEELENTVMEMAKKIMSKGPIAIKAALSAINRGMEMDLESGLSYETEMEILCFFTEDSREGLRAFIEKREPQFKGK
ncbi:MAG: enoyl-CoA hydratase-related protein [Candidatus Syntropharchaeia archaeon]